MSSVRETLNTAGQLGVWKPWSRVDKSVAQAPERSMPRLLGFFVFCFFTSWLPGSAFDHQLKKKKILVVD